MLIFHWFWHANVNISLVSDGFVNTHVDIPLVLERITNIYQLRHWFLHENVNISLVLERKC